jgi:two-component system, cell cycle sensor histidine kinase and response regulator CckA
MPGLTGPDLYKQLLGRHPRMKALFMSGYTGNIVEASGLADHNSNYIKKPFSDNELTAEIGWFWGNN